MQYQWVIDGLYKVPANIVVNELDKIGSDVTPIKVVEVARNSSNVLHTLFEWNDTIAAENYRVIQARRVINSIIIKTEVKRDEVEPTKVRYYVSTGMNDGTYKTISSVVRVQDDYDDLLKRANDELMAFRRKYNNLLEFKELFEWMDGQALVV